MYEQSWSWDKNELDAMWRIYRKDNLGVRNKFEDEENLKATKEFIKYCENLSRKMS